MCVMNYYPLLFKEIRGMAFRLMLGVGSAYVETKQASVASVDACCYLDVAKDATPSKGQNKPTTVFYHDSYY